MDPQSLIKILGDFGGIAVLAAVLLWQNVRTTAKLQDVIEKNSVALAELKELIRELCEQRRFTRERMDNNLNQERQNG